MKLLDRLRNQFPTAKQQTLRRMVQDGRVLVNAAPARKANQDVTENDRVVIRPVVIRPAEKVSARLPFKIVYEDRDVLIIDKPPGMLTSTTARETRPTAFAAVRQYVKQKEPAARVGLVHRLDRDASGLLVFAKNSLALSSLKRQFAHHSVTRIYHAIVSPPPRDHRRIESYLLERADGSVHSTNIPGRGQKAVTHFHITEQRGKFALLRIRLETGRKHQIRAHLSEQAHAIVGDRQYKGPPSKNGLMLIAAELAFTHPRTQKTISIKIPPESNRITAAFTNDSF